MEGALEQTDFAKHLDVMAFRTCDRLTGRFNSVDKLSAAMPGWNGYQMSFNSPINFTDPTGLMPSATADGQEIVGEKSAARDERMAAAREEGGNPPSPSSKGWSGQFYGNNYHVWTKGNMQIHQYWNGENWQQQTINTDQTGTGSGLSVNPNFNSYSQFQEDVSSLAFKAISTALLNFGGGGVSQSFIRNRNFFGLKKGFGIFGKKGLNIRNYKICLLYTSPSPRDATLSRMPSSA